MCQLMMLTCLQQQRSWLLLQCLLRPGQKQTSMLMLHLQAPLHQLARQQQVAQPVAAVLQLPDQGAASSSSSSRSLQLWRTLHSLQLTPLVAAVLQLPAQGADSSSSLQVQEQQLTVVVLLNSLRMLMLVAAAQQLPDQGAVSSSLQPEQQLLVMLLKSLQMLVLVTAAQQPRV